MRIYINQDISEDFGFSYDNLNQTEIIHSSALEKALVNYYGNLNGIVDWLKVSRDLHLIGMGFGHWTVE